MFKTRQALVSKQMKQQLTNPSLELLDQAHRCPASHTWMSSLDVEAGYALKSQFSERSVGLDLVQILAAPLNNHLTLRKLKFNLSDPHLSWYEIAIIFSSKDVGKLK